jgi:hypothetical protein
MDFHMSISGFEDARDFIEEINQNLKEEKIWD